MIPVATNAQMRECDRVTIEEIGLPGIVLMENASRSVASQILEMFDSDVNGKDVQVYCGKGNNGGDGFAVARHLKNLGANVDVFLIGEIQKLRGDARLNCDLFLRIGGQVKEILSSGELRRSKPVPDLIVDALLGTGFEGEVREIFARAIELINGYNTLTVAVDVPSGVDSDSGKSSEYTVKANVTVTFGLIKRGLLVSPGREFVGRLIVTDIGIPPQVVSGRQIVLSLVEEQDVKAQIPKRHPAAHKGDAGHVYILAGSPGLTGAAAMCANAAMRTGAGLVVAGIPKSLNPVLEAKLDEVMTQPLPETDSGVLSVEAVSEILPRLEWADCVVIGPGIGWDSDVAELLEEILGKITCPLVIDADGLNILSDFPSLFRKLPSGTVLTPHPGEFRRMTGISSAELENDRFKAVSKWAGKWSSTVILKGSPTVIAKPNGRSYINTTGNPGMATGGSGDVLSGVIAGLIAQGVKSDAAAWTAVYIHGAAGDRAAELKGIHGMVAGDIIAQLPETMKLMR